MSKLLSNVLGELTQSEEKAVRLYRYVSDFLDREENPDYLYMEFDQKLKLVLDTGYNMMDRTGKGVRYLPGVSVDFDISKRFPITTRRGTNWKSMLKEYLWFLTGSDNINDLNAMGSKVWDFWKDDDFTSSNGYAQGSIGYGYGPNLIHYGADLLELENNPGVNQVEYVLDLLKNDPNSRRILFTLWRPDKLKKGDVKLPPCHHTYQWIVEPDENGEMKNLSCVLYARSTDAFVGGLTTNVQGAAFYTYMLAQQMGMKPSKLTFVSAHFHIYNDHIPLVKEYLARPIPKSPILILNKKDSMYDYTADDFKLVEYEPLAKMIVPIAV